MRFQSLTLIAILGAIVPACAKEQDCSALFYGGQAPVLTNPKLSEKTQQLCFSEFTILHSGLSHGPLWSAEDLTREHLAVAVGLRRPASNAFHEEASPPPSERSSLDDYRLSGFDRGHVTPNSDMSNPVSQQESFTLANVVPQEPCNNEVLWEGIESAVRNLAADEGEVYIVTGPAFIGTEIQSLKERVLVPTHLYKAIYIPSRDQGGAYWAPNNDSQTWEAISLDELKNRSGIDAFPGVAESAKSKAANLPQPVSHFGCRLGGGRTSQDPLKQYPFNWWHRHRHSLWVQRSFGAWV